MSEIIYQIRDFLGDGNKRTAWLKDSRFEVYVRKARHLDEEGKLTPTFDIANITCREPGKGNFTRLLANLEKTSPFPIYIESVINEELEPFFIKRGYKQVPNTNPKCFILPINSKLS